MMSQNIETTFYIQGMSIPDKLNVLSDRLTDICDRIEDIAYEISRKEVMGS